MSNEENYIIENEITDPTKKQEYWNTGRNALVRSNYGNIPKGIYPTFDYLVMFFENLLQGKNNELENKELYIKELFENNN